MENASFGKTGLKKQLGKPKMSVQEIVVGLGMGLMFVPMKLFLPSSAAPAIAR